MAAAPEPLPDTKVVKDGVEGAHVEKVPEESELVQRMNTLNPPVTVSALSMTTITRNES